MKVKTKTVLVVDPNEATLHTFKRLLKNQGFESVMNLAGGIDAWSQEVDPNLPRY